MTSNDKNFNIQARGKSIMTVQSRFKALVAIASVTGMVATPAYADDSSTATTGVAAALGLATADGKSTIGDGAGAIEAALLESEAMAQAGIAIRKWAADAAGTRPVFVLTKNDTYDLTTAWWISQQADLLVANSEKLLQVQCEPVPKKKPKKQSQLNLIEAVVGEAATPAKAGFSPGLSDIGAALTTSVSLGKITLAADDRILVNAILTGRNQAKPRWSNLTGMQELGRVPTAPTAAPQGGPQFIFLGDPARLSSSENPLLHKVVTLQSDADKLGKLACNKDASKQAIAAINKFIDTITDGSKGPAAIVLAARLAAVDKDRELHKLPVILRVSVDERGGTSIARSNIWYSVGFPGATVVSSGLKISFQINDPEDGTNLITGEIRCATHPTSFRDVRKMLITQDETYGPNSIGQKQIELTTCGFRTS